MTLSEELAWRGFIAQTTFDDIKKIDEQKWTFYHGFDASAPSQTVGNLAAMMFDKVLLRHGHAGIVLAGGATSLIGDPGGKDKERVLQDEETIATNVDLARQQLEKVLVGHEFTLVNNLDWTKDMTVLEFLRDIGKHFSMTPLVQRDYIAQRMGQGGAGISYTEFSYTLLQGMDFLHLYDTYGCTLQLGGSDQWGNCLSGVDLIRRARGVEAHVITLPLIINKATGVKFGKSEDGAVWLDPERTSVYKFYQFWLNTDDESVEDYLKIFTELDKEVIDGVVARFTSDRSAREAQKALAYEVTKLVHGEARAVSVQTISGVLFGGEAFSKLSEQDMDELASELLVVEAQTDLAATLITGELATSRTEAMRFIESGAVYANGQKVTSGNDVHLNPGLNLLRRGKNSYILVKSK